MSVGDFAGRVAAAATGTSSDSLADLVAEFGFGARARLRYWRCPDRVLSVRTPTGDTMRWLATGTADARRGLGFQAEQAVVRWLFDDLGGATLWDIGSYHGNYAVAAAVGGAAQVRAFEPHPEDRGRLQTNVALNNVGGCVTVDGRALGATTAETTVASGGGARLGDGGAAVQVVPGDSIAEQPDLVKIDVEGHGPAVLDGLAGTLAGVRRIVVETHDGTSPRVREQLRNAGFAVETVPCSRPHTYVGGVRR